MAQFPALPLWTDAQKVHGVLVEDGWCSPDTYCNFFAPFIDNSAVYLFLLHRRSDDYRTAMVAYVGMSTRLTQRMASHDVLPELYTPDCWPMRWFKPTPAEKLRETERKYIVRFDPPWNIVGQRRGVDLS